MPETAAIAAARALGLVAGAVLAVPACLFPGASAAAETPPAPVAPMPSVAPLPEAPPELQRWREWVLAKHRDLRCPFLHNDSKRRYCAWPLSLRLDLSERGGRFRADWVLETEDWVFLPGGAGAWPRQVRVGGVARPLLRRLGRPAMRLEAGRHRLEGQFAWSELPATLQLPVGGGRLELYLDGERVTRPRLEKDGRLWLREQAAALEARLAIAVVRLLEDEIPQQLQTLLLLEVSGPAREEVLGPLLPDGALPMEVSGPLPARLEEDGRLRVQLRPGSWVLRLRSRQPGPVQLLQLPPARPPLPALETWAFAARPLLRQVRLEGAEQVDARLTRLPGNWQEFPAYQVESGGELRFPLLQEAADGSAQPRAGEIPRLHLKREMWLDFDGRGYTILDELQGERIQVGRLEVEAELHLGRVLLNGEPQYITYRPAAERRGVKLRGGPLRALAESRYEGSSRRFPASGWDQDLHRAEVLLHLPPGWQLFTAGGPDRVQERADWVRFWDVYKLFFVLLAVIAVKWMFGLRWALLTLFAMALCWNEFRGFQGTGWFWMLAALSLLQVLRKADYPRVRRLLLGCGWGLWLLMVLVQLPFMVMQLRNGISPQLEFPTFQAELSARQAATVSGPGPSEQLQKPRARDAPAGLRAVGKVPEVQYPDPGTSQLYLPTGPGLPAWEWRQVSMAWDSPVQQGQVMSLWLIPPSLNLLLCIARVLSVLALLFLLWRELRRSAAPPDQTPEAVPPGTSHALLWPAGLLLLGSAGGAGPARAEYPPPELLQEYEQRLLRAPECLPDCAQFQRLRVSLHGEQLELRLELHARDWVAVPLPGGRNSWLPATLLLGGQEGISTQAGEQQLLRMPPGIHQILAAGPVPPGAIFDLLLPLQPQVLELDLGPGWEQQGVAADRGAPHSVLRLRRTRPVAAQKPIMPGPEQPAAVLEQGDYPVFLEVRRHLLLGVAQRRVRTQVRILAPPDGTAVERVPLLPGEIVLSEDTVVEDGTVLVNLGGTRRQQEWASVLEQQEFLALSAADNSTWIERWVITDRSQVLLEYQGLQPLPRAPSDLDLHWQPWPGEQVQLRMRPLRSAAGPDLTIERVRAELRAGSEISDLELTLEVRAARAGEQKLLLPAGMRVQGVQRDSRDLQVLQRERELILDLLPGEQSFRIQARTEEGVRSWFRFPELQLPVPAVNVEQVLRFSRDRWSLLLGGPLLGPAVLFWPILLVLVLFSVLLGRWRLIPLQTWQWLLLGLGLALTQWGVVWGLLILPWFPAMALRARHAERLSPGTFNLVQGGLILLTLLFGIGLLAVIRAGLLGLPEMQISGNSSGPGDLRWFQDRTPAELPRPWAWSFPVGVYHALMLAWAFWLADFVLRRLAWGWRCFSTAGIWRPAAWSSPSEAELKREEADPRQAENEPGSATAEPVPAGDRETDAEQK